MSQNVGGYLVELLAKNGIDTVFGIPGVHNLELYRGLTAAKIQAENLRYATSPGDLKVFSADIERGLKRMSLLINQLLHNIPPI